MDPAIENGHYNYTPYAYVYNNPIRFIDPFGLDSAQRAQAIEASWEDVNAKQGDNPEEWTNSDCSTTLDSWMQAAGESYLKAPWKSSGVTTIKENVITASKTDETVGLVEEADVAPGNAYMWQKENGSYHTALVADVVRDENGNITSITVNHSEQGRGFISESFDPSDQSSRWVSRTHSYFKWDSNPDAIRTINMDPVGVTAPGSMYLSPKPGFVR